MRQHCNNCLHCSHRVGAPLILYFRDYAHVARKRGVLRAASCAAPGCLVSLGPNFACKQMARRLLGASIRQTPDLHLYAGGGNRKLFGKIHAGGARSIHWRRSESAQQTEHRCVIIALERAGVAAGAAGNGNGPTWLPKVKAVIMARARPSVRKSRQHIGPVVER